MLTVLLCKVPALIVIVLFFGVSITIAQSLRNSFALPYTGFAAYSTVQGDPFSFTANQAALAAVKQLGIGLYGERRFLLKETSLYAFAAALPTSLGNFGIQVNYSGFTNFNENKIGLAYAKGLGDKLAVGIQFDYYTYHIPGYKSASVVNFQAGAIAHLTGKLNAGIHLYSQGGRKAGRTGAAMTAPGEKAAGVYKLGLGYDASDNFFISSEIVKEEDLPVNIIAGMQYHFAKQFFARAGFLSETSLLFAGAGIGWTNLRVDVGGSYHPQLGFSPGIMLVAGFGNTKEPVKPR